MKKIIFLLVFIFVATPLFAKDTMQLVYYDNGAPFSWEKDDQMQGILIDILTEAIQTRMGIPISHKGYPWARAQDMVKNSKADAFTTIPTSDRKIYTEVSNDPVLLVTFTLFTKKNGPKTEALKNVKTIADLKGFRIGHYIGSGWAKHYLKDMNVDWAPKVSQVLKKVVAGRVDVFVDSSRGVRYNINKFGFKDQIVEIPNILASAPFHLCIGKKSSFVKILPQFDKTLKSMRKDGTLEKIYTRYR